jgi:hypothetical protein
VGPHTGTPSARLGAGLARYGWWWCCAGLRADKPPSVVAFVPSCDVARVHDAPAPTDPDRMHEASYRANAAYRLALWVPGWRPRRASLPTPMHSLYRRSPPPIPTPSHTPKDVTNDKAEVGATTFALAHTLQRRRRRSVARRAKRRGAVPLRGVLAKKRGAVPLRGVCSPFRRRTDGVGVVMCMVEASVVAPTSAGPYCWFRPARVANVSARAATMSSRLRTRRTSRSSKPARWRLLGRVPS